jgi:5-methylthioribose kinase
MLELRPDNVERYLREHDRIRGSAEVTVLAGGVSNVVFRVRSGSDLFVLKQSRPQLRTRDAWFSDVRRIFRELEVMRALADVLPESVVPRVVWEDRDNFTFAMTHAPMNARPWKEDMLAGTVDPERGRQAGEVLGKMHEFSAGHPERFQAFADSQVFYELRVEPFYERVAGRRPDVAAELGVLIDEMKGQIALCHGDYTPKNMLLHDSGFTLVDYETGYFGDPAMDIGLFVAHLVLKSMRAEVTQAARYLETIRAFWSAYSDELTTLSASEQRQRGLRHLGACLLARVDGASPVDYLTDDGKNTARRFARQILHNQRGLWETLLK